MSNTEQNTTTNIAPDLKVNNLPKVVDTAISMTKKSRKMMQKALRGVAYSVANHKDVSQLTRIIKAFSRVDSNNKYHLNKTAQAISLYMIDLLPIYWNTESQTFKVNVTKIDDIDWDLLEISMFTTTYEDYKPIPADKLLVPSKVISQMINLAKKIAEDSLEHQESYKNPENKQALELATGFLRRAA